MHVYSRLLRLATLHYCSNPRALPRDLGGPTHLGLTLGRPRLLLVPFIRCAVSFGGLARGEGLLEVVDDVINVLVADRDPDQVLGDAAVGLFLVRELLVGGGPRVDGQRFGVTDAVATGEVSMEPEQILAGEGRTLRGWR